MQGLQAGRQKKLRGRAGKGWEGVVAMGVALAGLGGVEAIRKARDYAELA